MMDSHSSLSIANLPIYSHSPCSHKSCDVSDTESATDLGQHSPNIWSNDIGIYSKHNLECLDDGKRLWILKNAYKSAMDYKFPTKIEYDKNRYFQFSWLKQYPWLSYSCSKNGGYCTPCFLFAKDSFSLGQLVNVPLTNFTRAKQTLIDHSVQRTHRRAMQDATAFLGHMERGHLSICQHL